MNILESNNGDIAHDEGGEGESDEDDFEVQKDSHNFTLRFSASYALGEISKCLPDETFSNLMPCF